MSETKKRKQFEAALLSMADVLTRAAAVGPSGAANTKTGKPGGNDDTIAPPSTQAAALLSMADVLTRAAVGPSGAANTKTGKPGGNDDTIDAALSDLALDDDERAVARARFLAPRVELGGGAEWLLLEALAAAGDPELCGLLGQDALEELVCALERLPEVCLPLWDCFYGRQPCAELMVSLVPGPLDRMLALLVWRGARSVNELAWRRAIGGLAVRARWMVTRSREVEV